MDFVFVCPEARRRRFGTFFWDPLAAIRDNRRFLVQVAERIKQLRIFRVFFTDWIQVWPAAPRGWRGVAVSGSSSPQMGR
jgi:hypothetical protein